MQELEKILSTVVRSNVRQIIVQSISSLKTQIDTLEVEKKKQEASSKTDTTQENEMKSTSKPVYTTKITTYGKVIGKIPFYF